MNLPRTENVMVAITFLAGLAVAACIPSPYGQNTEFAARTMPASSTETADDDQTLPDLTVVDVDIRRLAHTQTLA